MEEAQREIRKKISKLGIKMKNFTYHDVNEFTVDECKTKISELDEALETAAEAITDLFEYYGLEMSQELKFDMDKIYDKLFDDVKICRDQIAKKAVEVKDEIAVKKNTSCGTSFEDGDGSFQAEKLELLKRQVAAMELANQNAVNIGIWQFFTTVRNRKRPGNRFFTGFLLQL